MAQTLSFGSGLSEIDPPQYVRQRAMADALIGQSQGPISGWGEGVANLARTAAGVYLGKKADAGKVTAAKARADVLKNAMASGDPLAALANSEDPELQSLAMNYQMAKLLQDPKETYATLTDEEERAMGLDPSGTYQRGSLNNKVDVLTAPKAPDAPTVKDFYEGGEVIQKQYDPQTNAWIEVGRGNRWQPQQGPQPSDRHKRALEGGLVPGTEAYNKFVLGSDTPDSTKIDNVLRDEFNTLSKDFRTVQDAYSKIEATSPTGAGDMSMLYSYVKLLDPGSVVRESEFATAAASGSFGEQVQGAVSRIMSGERLPDTLRASFKAEAKAIYKAQQAGYERLKKSYEGVATRSGANPQNVIVDYTAPEIVVPPPANTPAGPDERGGLPITNKYGLTPKAP